MQTQRETTDICYNYRSALLIQIQREKTQVQVSLQILNDHIFLQSMKLSQYWWFQNFANTFLESNKHHTTKEICIFHGAHCVRTHITWQHASCLARLFNNKRQFVNYKKSDREKSVNIAGLPTVESRDWGRETRYCGNYNQVVMIIKASFRFVTSIGGCLYKFLLLYISAFILSINKGQVAQLAPTPLRSLTWSSVRFPVSPEWQGSLHCKARQPMWKTP